MTCSGPYRSSGNEAETTPLPILKLKQEIERLENHPEPYSYPGGQRGLSFEVAYLREQLEKILAECRK